MTLCLALLLFPASTATTANDVPTATGSARRSLRHLRDDKEENGELSIVKHKRARRTYSAKRHWLFLVHKSNPISVAAPKTVGERSARKDSYLATHTPLTIVGLPAFG